MNLFNILIQIIKDNKTYFKQIVFFGNLQKDKSFKDSDIGWFWALGKPMIRIAVYYFAMCIGFRSSSGSDMECPYLVWLVAGLTPWFFMSAMIVGGANCFSTHRILLRNSALPATVLPSIVVASNVKVNLIITGIMIAISLVMGNFPTIYWLQLPFYMIMMLMISYLWTMVAGLLTVVHKDVRNLLSTLSMALFWLSGIIFDVSNINNIYVKVVFWLNPVTYIVSGYRNAICMKTWFFEDRMSLIFFAGVAVVFLFLSLRLYSGLRKRLPDVV